MAFLDNSRDMSKARLPHWLDCQKEINIKEDKWETLILPRQSY